eukprot:jgi/Picsp_1/3280/NSC_06120-R1_predicted protein [Chlamydomonas reinhardtii]
MGVSSSSAPGHAGVGSKPHGLPGIRAEGFWKRNMVRNISDKCSFEHNLRDISRFCLGGGSIDGVGECSSLGSSGMLEKAMQEGGMSIGKTANLTSLTGKWRKNKNKSDCMREACDMVELPFVFRKALAFLNVLEIQDDGEYFRTILKAGGIMDVVEVYPWKDCKPVVHRRRDKRRGKHLGSVRREDGHPQIVVSWDDPFGGVCSDTFVLSEDGMELKQVTEMEIVASKKRTKYVTVYSRI